MGTSKSVLLFAQLPERNGAGGGNVEGIDPVGHGDAHRVIAGGNGGVGKAITLGAQHDGQLWLGGQGGIVDRNRKVGQRHGGGLEAESVQLLHALLRPVGGGGADLGPGHLEHGAHADPHGPAAQGIAAGGCDEHRVHVQGGGTAEDGPDVGGIHNAFQHGHPAGIAADFLHRGQQGTVHRAQHAAGQLEAGQLGQHGAVSGLHRGIPAAGKNLAGRAGDLLALH